MKELAINIPSEIFLQPVTMVDIKAQAERASLMVEEIRSRMLSPTATKTGPVFIQKEVAEACGLEPGQFTYRMKNTDLAALPSGHWDAKSRRREFSLAEMRTWVKEFRKDRLRPDGGEAVVIAVANFKGGVGKSTTTMTLAQGLSLLGHRVLIIDADPQGSLSTLTGLVPDIDVSEEDTFLPLCLGAEVSIRYAIRPTYWDGMDIVAAAPLLFGIEFSLPSRQVKEGVNGFEFWNVLNYGIDEVRQDYDVILIDTAPALSYGTVNALYAANGIIMPLPPNALDFASGAQFWTLFTDLAENLIGAAGVEKRFDFINVLLSRVDNDDASTMVRKWIIQTYGDKVLPAEIPRTVVTSAASAEFNTVYDISRYDGNARTYKRARDAYDNLVQYMEGVVRAVWQRDVRRKQAAGALHAATAEV